MGTYSLELDFREPSKDDLPGPPIAQIYIKAYSIDKRGYHIITPRCVSFREIDYEITRLEKELKSVRNKARRKFKS